MAEAAAKKQDFSLCLEEHVAKQMDKESNCQKCTARGEIQDEIKILSVRL